MDATPQQIAVREYWNKHSNTYYHKHKARILEKRKQKYAERYAAPITSTPDIIIDDKQV